MPSLSILLNNYFSTKSEIKSMENPEERRDLTNPHQEEEKVNAGMKSSRRPTETKKKSTKKSYKEHQNPIVRALARTGYTVWLVVMGIGIVIAFVVSVAVL